MKTTESIGATFQQFKSGLTLIHQEMTTAAVTVDIWVQAGAIAEPQNWSGIAHFLEHMIFKGTDKILPGQFDAIIESQGGVTNAATSHDYAHYMFTIAATNFASTLPHLIEMLLHASIPDQEFDQERSVVLAEMHQAMDNPDWLAYQEVVQAAYGQHPYGRSVLGSEEVINNLTPQDMRKFWGDRYRPELMTIAVVGAVSLAETEQVINQAFNFGDYAGATHSNPVSAPIPVIRGIQRQTIYLPRLQHSRLTMAWLGAGINDLEAACGLEIISVILAEGRTSRLVRTLREELGWVQDIGSGFALQREPGLFTVNAYLDSTFLEPVEHKIREEIYQFSEVLVTDQELQRAKRSLSNNFAFGLESPNQLASFLGYHGMLGCKDFCINWSTAYVGIVNKLTAAALQSLAQKYLSPDHYIVTSAIPQESPQESMIASRLCK